MREIPVLLRNQLVDITHGPIQDNISFFRNKGKSSDFNQAIIYQLQPFSISDGELLYQSGEDADNIYFIFHGTF
jgi:CRP-like cAMP-binding protein